MSMRGRWKSLAFLAATCLVAGSAGVEAADAVTRNLLAGKRLMPEPVPAFTGRLLAKADPDECFAGIGEDYPAPGPNGTCPQGGRPKTNEAYVWGLVQTANDRLWFGTAPNVHCLVIGGFLGWTQAHRTRSWVCELGESELARENPALPAAVGDWRPPSVYEYDANTRRLVERSPMDDPLFRTTLGLRSAGTKGGLVFLAGPALGTGINFFAFDVRTGALRGSCNAPAFTNIRQWILYYGALYAGVGTSSGGGLIRWVGTEKNPFKRQGDRPDPNCGFVTAAELPGDAAYVTPVKGRLAVSTWPSSFTGRTGAGIYLGPPAGKDGVLTPADGTWERLWQPADYEPDLITRLTYGGGAIAEWNGALYFATMHVPGMSAVAHARCENDRCFGAPADAKEAIQLFLGSYRAISVWRISNPTSPALRRVELLYGESALPALEPGTKSFRLEPTGWTPLFGPSGFGNPLNNYGWTAAVVNGKLLMGTMDWGYLLMASIEQALPGLGLDSVTLSGLLGPARESLGADLWRFDTPGRRAVPESLNGLGNNLNYGIRSMIAARDGKSAFIGTANPMNLEPEGGWELRRLVAKGR